MMKRIISMGHGSGGKQTHELIREVFAVCFDMCEPLTDSAILSIPGERIAFTTDSYVVHPLFFPGGNIGRLAVCGTVNDLAVSGAKPMYLSASFIIEEGFALDDLKALSVSMSESAGQAGVKIVTGDTKVVEKGKCDGLYITTCGTGLLPAGREHICTGSRIKPGDRLILNGPLGNHSIAVLGARNNLSFTTTVVSDCAPLNNMIESLCNKCSEILFMRDLTRGGLAGVLNELAQITGNGILIDENLIPVDDQVRGACEMLGFDPLYLANEGKVLIVAGRGTESEVLKILRSDPHGRKSEIIGEIIPDVQKHVVMTSFTGGKRIVDIPSGVQLPRIC